MSPQEGEDTVTVAITVAFVLLSALVIPPVAGMADDGEMTPLRVENVTVGSDMSLVKSDFGAGTYHFSAIPIELYGLVGRGYVIVQIGVPELNSYVLTRQIKVGSQQPVNRKLVYQPSVEIHPDRVKKDSYLAQIKVRIRSGTESSVVVDLSTEIEVTDETS